MFLPGRLLMLFTVGLCGLRSALSYICRLRSDETSSSFPPVIPVYSPHPSSPQTFSSSLVLVQCCFFFFYSFSFLHPAVPCSAGAAPPASRQNSSIRAQEKQKMAVAGCPDYFLHHPNYQVSGHLLSDFFFYVLIIDDVIDCVFLT